MSKKMLLMLVAMMFMVSLVNADEWDDDADDAAAPAAAPAAAADDDDADDADAPAPAAEAVAVDDDAEEPAEAAPVAVEEVAVDAIVVGGALETAVEPEVEPEVPEAGEKSSWFSGFWPFGKSKAEPAAGDAGVAEVAAVEEPPAEPAIGKGEEKSEGSSVGRAILLYIPNVLLNLTDIVSFGVGIGAKTSVEARVTRYCQVAANYGDSAFVEKGYERRLGGGHNNGYLFQFGPIRTEESYIDSNFGGVEDIVIKKPDSVIVSPKEEVYANGHRDFWAIGAELSWLVGGRVDIHPIEIADFLASLIGLDLTGDNLK